jgi:hypothetical protein
MKTSDKQYLAKILFTTQKLDQKIVAEKVGVSERTMSEWVNKFGWKKLRNRLLVGKEQILSDLYEELEEMNEAIRSKEKGKRYSDPKQADTKVKLTASIRNLETELSIADLVGAGSKFIKHLQVKKKYDLAITFAEEWNELIHAELKS